MTIKMNEWRESRTRRARQMFEIRRMYEELAGYILEIIDSNRLVNEFLRRIPIKHPFR